MTHNLTKEAMRKLLEDCWDASDLFQMNEFTKNKFPDKETYITSRLAALDDGQEGKGQRIDPKELMKTAVNDFNLYEHENEVDNNTMDAWLQTKEANQIAFLIGRAALPVADGEGEPELFNTNESIKAGNEMANKLFAEYDKEFRKDPNPPEIGVIENSSNKWSRKKIDTLKRLDESVMETKMLFFKEALEKILNHDKSDCWQIASKTLKQFK